MRKAIFPFFIILYGLITISSCGEEDCDSPPCDNPSDTLIIANCNPTLFDFSAIILPMIDTFPKLTQPSDNPATNEGVELGRYLFFDSIISLNNAISCASCHFANNYFQDNLAFSTNVAGGQTPFGTLPLINLVYKTKYFWNGRTSTLEATIEDAANGEHQVDWSKSITNIKADTQYVRMFQEAFCVKSIEKDMIIKSIAQYLRTLISNKTDYDQANLSMTADQGKLLFFSNSGGDCWHCHGIPLFGNNKPENNGLDSILTAGIFAVTGDSADLGRFLTPTLRNIEHTAPYMHDGRFATLEEVLDHYSEHVKLSATISPTMEFASAGGVQLNPMEKAQLIAFLKSLTDTDFKTNPRFQSPF